jgi:TetR/AcrR family transcriptional regulator, acrAB operon repressor
MARRTKEEAAATRDSILDAAEQLFVKQGVSRTTLQHIATAAGVTRGAIYWHFDDKGALFNAMMERATMPLEAAAALLERSQADDPLRDLRAFVLEVLRVTVEEPQARRVFEIASLKMEFVDELDAARVRRRENLAQWMGRAEGRIRLAAERGELRAGVNPHAEALGLWAVMDGLIRTWLFEPGSFDLVGVAAEIIDTHFAGLRPVPG